MVTVERTIEPETTLPMCTMTFSKYSVCPTGTNARFGVYGAIYEFQQRFFLTVRSAIPVAPFTWR